MTGAPYFASLATPAERQLADMRTRVAELRDTIERVQRRHPKVALLLSTPELGQSRCLTDGPQYFPDPLPDHARIRSCDQSPWDSIHVLANGDVMPCEVHDRTPIGNLARQTLKEIWHGEKYREFRIRYHEGAIPECRSCPWKLAYIPPARLWRWAGPGWGVPAQFLAGWYMGDDRPIVWSKPEATLVLDRPPGVCRLPSWSTRTRRPRPRSFRARFRREVELSLWGRRRLARGRSRWTIS